MWQVTAVNLAAGCLPLMQGYAEFPTRQEAGEWGRVQTLKWFDDNAWREGGVVNHNGDRLTREEIASFSEAGSLETADGEELLIIAWRQI